MQMKSGKVKMSYIYFPTDPHTETPSLVLRAHDDLQLFCAQSLSWAAAVFLQHVYA